MLSGSSVPTLINTREDEPESRNLKTPTNIRPKNQNCSINGQLNIISSGNSFVFCLKISQNLDPLLISETKIGN